MKGYNMYLIIKHQKYDHFNDDYTVAGTSDYLEGANELLEAHKIINKNKSITFTVVNLDGPLLLTDEVKDSKQMELPLE
jgi:hypothetical protein|tara:strand:+ start:1037 stop:1273 length:237 start_codon:yes stop_codon:yes gene_type:complete